MGTGTLRRAVAIPVVLAAAFLFTGCASQGTLSGPPAGEGDSIHHNGVEKLLPEPLGNVAFEDDPAIFLLGWLGMIAGGIAGGWLFVLAVRNGSGSGNGGGDAALYALILAVALGAVAGGLILTLPVRGLEALWEWIFD